MPPKKDTGAAAKEQEAQPDEKVQELENALAEAKRQMHDKLSEMHELREKIEGKERQMKDYELELEKLKQESDRLQTVERELDHANSNYQHEVEMREDTERALRHAEERISRMQAEGLQTRNAWPSAIPRQQDSPRDGSNSLRASQSGRPGVHSRPRHDVPLPRQMVFSGSESWESFIQSFSSMAAACEWDDYERLFRLKASLREEAAEYVFTQLPRDLSECYGDLVVALELRYKERRTVASYLAELEGRRLGQKEKLSEYVCDVRRLVIKGFPTADASTRDTIGLRYFLKGLQDQQMVVSVGMQNPTTIEAARAAAENYMSLKDEVNKPPRPRVNAVVEDAPCKSDTSKRLEQLENKIGDVMKLLQEKGDRDMPNKRSTGKKKLSEIECFKCHEMGHFARRCPNQPQPSNDAQQQESTTQGND